VPIPFELRYPRDRIVAQHRYGMRASILSPDGRLMFTNAAAQPVLEPPQASATVEIVVQRVSTEPGAAGNGNAGPVAAGEEPGAAPAAGATQAPPGAGAAGDVPLGPWRLVAIQRPGAAEEPVAAGGSYTIDFGAEGRYSGRADCNRYAGGYREPEPGRLVLSAGPTTLAACPPESLSSEFLRAVASVTAYEMRGEQLRLSYGDGGALVLVRDDPQAAAGQPVGSTFVFDCPGDVSFTVRNGPGEAALWAPKSLDGKYTVLGRVRSASGARYEEGGTVFWSKGDTALFEYAGRTFGDCKSNPSKVPWADAERRGVSVRALGNEPAWTLEVAPARLAMITELGARRTELGYPAPTVAGSRTTYRADGDGHEIVAVVERTACVDSMSGEAFEAAVTVTFDGKTFRGCGRCL
jgi:uncharacterized membrane protein/heat shock protein HslJ